MDKDAGAYNACQKKYHEFYRRIGKEDRMCSCFHGNYCGYKDEKHPSIYKVCEPAFPFFTGK
jgi:hypothetical protein